MTACSAREKGAESPGQIRPPGTQSPRYHALDSVRAAAMLLGVFYHWQFVGGGLGMMNSPKASIDHWLHSFRMALFFLISGFFANMMLGKYGFGRYLARRWWRIGTPLLVAIFAFAGLRFAQDYFPALAPPNPFDAPAMPGPWGGAPPGQGFPAPSPMTPGWGGMPGPGGMPAPATTRPAAGLPFGGWPPPMTASTAPAPGPTNWGPPPFGGTVPPAAPPVPPAAPPIPPFGMGGPPHPAMDWLLQAATPEFQRADGRPVRLRADHFMLQHLWFLWYLLLFVTLAPLVAKLFTKLFVRNGKGALDPAGHFLLRWNLAPLALGLLAVPLLVHARGMDWSLMNPAGFSGVFPDFVLQYFPDQPYYFLYFLAGWFLFRLREGLQAFARPWLWNLVLGIAGFALAQALYDRYAPTPSFPFFGMMPAPAVAAPEGIRLAAFALYAVGAAYSGFGLLGLFQKFFDRPSKLGQYFTDTMLWVYLVQLPLIPYLARWVDYQNTSWWAATLGGMVLVTGVALVLFELLIRPTPLVHIFGPASLGRRQKHEVPSNTGTSASVP